MSDEPLSLVCDLDRGDGRSVLSILFNGWDSIEVPYEHELLRYFTQNEARVLRGLCREFKEAVDVTPFETTELFNTVRFNFRGWSESFPAAQRLDIYSPDSELQSVAESGALSHLKYLTVTPSYGYGMPPSSLHHLSVALSHMTSLRELTLYDLCEMDAATVHQLAAALPSSLLELSLGGNHIDDAGAAALAAAGLPSSLLHLGLAHNMIGTAGATALAAALPPSLLTLSLRYNRIDDAGAAALAAGLPPVLRILDLKDNEIGDAGATALAAALPRLVNLTDLKLTGNEIGEVGMCALAATLPSSLVQLKIGWNHMIGNASADALAAVVPRLHALTRVSFRATHIDSEHEALIRAAAPAGCTVKSK